MCKSSNAAIVPLVEEDLLARQQRRVESECQEIWALLDQVKDPEIPVVSIWDLGILQDVRYEGDMVLVVITPTYSGCPAMGEIQADIRRVLHGAGYPGVRVESRLAPAWTTAWITANGRRQLQRFGISPPSARAKGKHMSMAMVVCPRCGSFNTDALSEYGSTACKAIYRCEDCLEPFDYFKCI